MIQEVSIKATNCICNICHYQWVSIAATLPDTCRNRDCRSREWNGKKKRVRKAKTRIELPKPTKVRWVEEETEF